jgi:hypothetical protein
LTLGIAANHQAVFPVVPGDVSDRVLVVVGSPANHLQVPVNPSTAFTASALPSASLDEL